MSDRVARVAWVQSDAARREESRRVSALVGRQIVGGRYFDLAYPNAAELWDGRDLHALDYGVEIDVDDGSTWSFIWQMDGDHESVLAYEGKLVGDELRAELEYTVVSVDTLPAWRPLLGAVIDHVESAWENAGGDLCPVSWIITTASGGFLCLTLGKKGEDGQFKSSDDDIAVFFSREAAEQHNVTTGRGGIRASPLGKPRRGSRYRPPLPAWMTGGHRDSPPQD